MRSPLLGAFWASNARGSGDRLRALVVTGGSPRTAADAFSREYPDETRVLVLWEIDGKEYTARFNRDADNLGGKPHV